MADGAMDEAGRLRNTTGIVLDDWQENRPAEPTARRERQTLFGARSPIARRIIAFNVLALGALVIGVLYLTQFDEALIVERERAILSEARAIAQGIALDAPPDFGDPARDEANAVAARRYLSRLGLATFNRIRLYDREGRMMADSLNVPNAGALRLTAVRPRSGGLFGPILDRVRDVFTEGKPVTSETLKPGITSDPKVFRALEGRLAADRATDVEGRMIVGVALPIAQAGKVLGAILVSSRPGEIDQMVSNQRAQLLQVFAIALMVSVGLSLVLANTIARPLQRLAEAAEQSEGRTSRLMNPERIRIPDLTGRPDEIGYLSGAMRKMTEALYDRIEQSEVFSAEVAHEIKNPLTSLRSAVETLRLTHSDDARERLLAVIEKDVTRLDRLVTDISNASRLDSEMVREELEPFSMRELLSNLVEFNAPKASEVGGGLIADLPEDDPLMTKGIEGRLAQVFVNLISNAISFTGEGGVIRVAGSRKPDGTIRVTVSDAGPGIPEENLKDIFSRFYSERPQKEFGNHSGLGLAISKQIVDAHGGRIWAENIREPGDRPDAPPRGARFTVELPQ
ncbi:MAG: HAMP domain-containing protein [Alphaproteobacteria bacterium]|nr:MAG: HAMP domain-containing protein [Alphaproteobacteria bacterium]